MFTIIEQHSTEGWNQPDAQSKLDHELPQYVVIYGSARCDNTVYFGWSSHVIGTASSCSEVEEMILADAAERVQHNIDYLNQSGREIDVSDRITLDWSYPPKDTSVTDRGTDVDGAEFITALAELGDIYFYAGLGEYLCNYTVDELRECAEDPELVYHYAEQDGRYLLFDVAAQAEELLEDYKSRVATNAGGG